MSFVDALNAPLPSKKQITAPDTDESVLEESVSDEIDQMIASLITESDVEDDDVDTDEISGDDIDDVDGEDDDDDLNPDELDDDELAELDAELSGDALKAAAGVDDDEPEEKLSPSEELQADDMMAVAATTMLVNDEINAEERAQFLESGEAKIAVAEGFMTEAVDAMLKFGFEDYGLNRIVAKVIKGNAGSVKVLQKLGFVQEGIQREGLCKNGQYHDLIVFSILKSEYHAH